jgi:hypothetical protein
MPSWPYVAGYFDGEGHVSLHATKRGDKTRALVWYNTHRESLEAIQAFIDCGFVRAGVMSAGKNRVPYTLSVSKKADLIRVIDGMIPHLIVKREPALRLREYLMSDVGEQSPNFGKMAAVSDGDLRRMYYEERMSYSAIAAEVGVSYRAVAQAMRKRGFKARSVSEATKGKPKSEITRQRMRAAWALRRQAPTTEARA